ncbi:MAG: hypothetical protein K2H40_00450 [Lachnospiraceae bacterium]|nr:hypothetical protein [Lachnospiraceae bacterium]
MKNKAKAGRLTVLLGALGLVCVVTGCTKTGEKAEGQEEDVIRIETSMDENAAKDESGQQSDDGKQEQKDDQEEDAKEGTSETTAQISDENSDNARDSEQDENELEGDVRSVGEDSMVVSKIFNYTEDDASIAVSYAEGGSDETLITVYFSEDTEYIVRTVKNGGVNGDSDVEDRAGALTDIREGNTVLMNGSYEGEDFHAVQVIIYNFI